MTGNDYKFSPGKSYVVTSALLFEQTGQLTLWQQVGDASISWGQTVAFFEEYKHALEWGDRAWMLKMERIKERFRAHRQTATSSARSTRAAGSPTARASLQCWRIGTTP